jgi:dihydropyrimidine dehydrogenase (NADP+)
MTPNITEVSDIARAAIEGGATGVTAVNTISTLQTLKSTGEPWPAVGPQKLTTYGGMSGSANRPVALRAVATIANRIKEAKIMATGGIESAETAIQFMHVGAPLVQICSAIQNQDFTVVEDYITGLKTHLYMQSRPDLKSWDVQLPPKDPSKYLSTGNLPRFGEYEMMRWKKNQEMHASPPDTTIPASEQKPVPPQPPKIPRVQDIVGKSLDNMSSFTDMDNKSQVVAAVDDELCINCGKCYMTCNDSGYQAITFDPKTHQPFITDECTGCTLCASVCPIPDCITMVPKTIPHVVKRGIPLGAPQVPPS